jgi:methyl-accepting chemotaxis protein
MTEKPAFRRRQYLIKRGMQFRYIGIVFSLALLASIVTGYTVFATGWTLLGEKLANVYPQGRLVAVLRTTNLTLIRNLFIISPFVFMLGLLFSHKIAGPVYKIEKNVDEIANGNLSLRVRLRKGDELVDLADIVNKMVENIDKSVGMSKRDVLDIQKDLTEIKKIIFSRSDNPAEIEASINRLELKLNKLDASLNKWTTS